MLRVARAVSAVLFAVVAAPAFAGIADSPLPVGFTVLAYSVPGIINTGSAGTFFSCTNVDAALVTIAVEVFGQAGGSPLNTASTTAIGVAPGATVMFGTQPAPGFTVDASLNPGAVTKGSARIIATSKKIDCTAFAADPNAAVATYAFQLTIIAKTKQKAAN